MLGIAKNLSETSTARRSSRTPGATDGREGGPTHANRRFTLGARVGFKNKISWIVMSIVFAAPRSAFACAACTGRSDDAVAQGINAAVFTLLFVLLVVLGGIVSFLVYLIHRAAKHPLALPDAPASAIASTSTRFLCDFHAHRRQRFDTGLR